MDDEHQLAGFAAGHILLAYETDAGQSIVSSALYRDDAHGFYESIGYVHTSKQFRKFLAGD